MPLRTQVYDKYVIDKSLYAVQEGARTARRGLWQDSEPIAPWLWRQAHRR